MNIRFSYKSLHGKIIFTSKTVIVTIHSFAVPELCMSTSEASSRDDVAAVNILHTTTAALTASQSMGRSCGLEPFAEPVNYFPSLVRGNGAGFFQRILTSFKCSYNSIIAFNGLHLGSRMGENNYSYLDLRSIYRMLLFPIVYFIPVN